MTETLRQKIRHIFDYCVNEDGSVSIGQIGTDIDKALQEFGEAIKKLDTMTPIGFKAKYVDVKAVLALIGEKK